MLLSAAIDKKVRRTNGLGRGRDYVLTVYRCDNDSCVPRCVRGVRPERGLSRANPAVSGPHQVSRVEPVCNACELHHCQERVVVLDHAQAV
jgi:hypothetical protein